MGAAPRSVYHTKSLKVSKIIILKTIICIILNAFICHNKNYRVNLLYEQIGLRRRKESQLLNVEDILK